MFWLLAMALCCCSVLPKKVCMCKGTEMSAVLDVICESKLCGLWWAMLCAPLTRDFRGSRSREKPNTCYSVDQKCPLSWSSGGSVPPKLCHNGERVHSINFRFRGTTLLNYGFRVCFGRFLSFGLKYRIFSSTCTSGAHDIPVGLLVRGMCNTQVFVRMHDWKHLRVLHFPGLANGAGKFQHNVFLTIRKDIL